MNYTIGEMTREDWNRVSEIYLEGINTRVATFQTDVPSFEEWDENHIKSCRLVAKSEEGIVLGWVALSPTSSRCVYKGVAEVSIYVGNEYKGSGIGEALLKEVVKMSEKEGFWTLQSGIIKENLASREVHKKCGFRELGIRERVAKMNDDNWMDVVLMERRSEVVGIE